MQFSILGPLEVRADGHTPALGGPKPRALLAVLLLHANEPVSAERIALALWGENAPAGAVKTLQVHVSRLRKALDDPGRLTTTPGGYRLRVGAEELDLDRFQRLVTAGRHALAAGEPDRAGELLREALSLWRGAPLAEFAWAPFAPGEINRLEEQRLDAFELRVEADLAAGRHAEVIAELQLRISEYPWRERLHAQLMLALYRAGRQADALEAYRHARELLVEQLGIEPGTELRDLEQAILAQDAALASPRPAGPRDAGTAPARIPAPPTPTIGRDADLARLRAILSEPPCRLVTVVGTGGVGKTRLALELARAVGGGFADGARFVSLAPVSAHQHVATTIVQRLGVVVLPGESAADGLTRHLRERELLLVLDNFEHLLGAAPLVARVLAESTSLKVLATSREPLRIQAERLYRLDPLGLPPADGNDDGSATRRAPAVALFTAVVRARDATFTLTDDIAPTVAGVCRRLDGLPLAIELAAARLGLLTVHELASRLREGVQALGSGMRDAPARQRTLTATLEWSYDLLTPQEQAGLAALAVFAGGCAVDAAQAVTGASLDVLEALVEKNLVVRRELSDAATRLTLLETLADFARSRLAERHDGEAIRWRHFDHYLALAERYAPLIQRSRAPADVAPLDPEVHNVRAALAWALDRRAAVPALRLATAAHEYWDHHQLTAESARWLRAALALPQDEVPTSLRARALLAYARALDGPDQREECKAAARESLELARSIGDAAQCAASTSALAFAAMRVHDAKESYRLATAAEHLAREAGDEFQLSVALHIKAMMAPTMPEALAIAEEAVPLHRRIGGRWLESLQTSLVYTALHHGDVAAAQQLDAEVLRSAEALDYPALSVLVAGNHGLVTLLAGDLAGASAAFTGELQLADHHGYDAFLYEAISGLAAVAAGRGEDELAARLIGAANTTRPERHDPAIARQIEDRYFAPARARIGEDSWRKAYADGAALTPRQAVETALRSPPASVAARE